MPITTAILPLAVGPLPEEARPKLWQKAAPASRPRIVTALALLLTTDTATTARQLEARIKRLTRAQKDALIADPACLPDLCPALAGADIRPVPGVKLADYLHDMTNPADA